jgi:small GTP-binding protein
MYKIILFGLDRAGKTVLTKFLTEGVTDQTFLPTLSPNSNLFVLKQQKNRIWDMPGQQKFRNIWANYLVGSNLIIYMIDTADLSRLPETKQEFTGLLKAIEEKLSSKPPLLLLYNKMDLPEAQTNFQTCSDLFKEQLNYKGIFLELAISMKDVTSLEKVRQLLIDNLKI